MVKKKKRAPKTQICEYTTAGLRAASERISAVSMSAVSLYVFGVKRSFPSREEFERPMCHMLCVLCGLLFASCRERINSTAFHTNRRNKKKKKTNEHTFFLRTNM